MITKAEKASILDEIMKARLAATKAMAQIDAAFKALAAYIEALPTNQIMPGK